MKKGPESFDQSKKEYEPGIKLRLAGVPAFGADKAELDKTPGEKSFPPNKILSYEARRLLTEGKVDMLFGDDVVGLHKDGETYSEKVLLPENKQEYEPTLFWAKEMKKAVEKLGLVLHEVQVILVAAPYHQKRCIMDLQGEGFTNIVIDEEMNKLGMEPFVSEHSSHVQSTNRMFSLGWEIALRKLKSLSPETYEKITLKRTKI